MLDTKAFEAPVKEEIQYYRNYYKNSLKSKTRLLDFIANYVHSRNRNNLLPLLTLLCAKVCGNITTNTFVAASVIDHLYTATVIHDDVEDESFTSWGFGKINTLWREKLSVLMGDYFLARGLLLSVNNKTYDVLEIVSKSVKEITEGELCMLNTSNTLSCDINGYFDIINKKSASLYAACSMAGAISTGADKESLKTISSFGRNYGIALFIHQDLIYENTIKNSRYRLTLPFILALENCEENDRNKMLRYTQYSINKKLTAYIQSFTHEYGGQDKALRLREDYEIKAIDDLTEFTYSESLEAIKQLVKFSLRN